MNWQAKQRVYGVLVIAIDLMIAVMLLAVLVKLTLG